MLGSVIETAESRFNLAHLLLTNYSLSIYLPLYEKVKEGRIKQMINEGDIILSFNQIMLRTSFVTTNTRKNKHNTEFTNVTSGR